MAADEVRRLVTDVEADMVDAQAFHLVVHRARHDVARGQLGAFVEARHEAFAVRQL